MNMQDTKDIIIEMVTYDDPTQLQEKKFTLMRSGITPYDYEKQLHVIKNSTATDFEADEMLASLFYPKAIGINIFKQEGMPDDIKAADVIKEFFVNDPQALQLLNEQLTLFLNPALALRIEKTSKQRN